MGLSQYCVLFRLLYDDCGSCTQLVVNMALEAGVSPDTVLMIVNNDLHYLAEETALVVRFTDLVLEHNPEAKDLRDEIVNHWGDNGLITLGLTISSCRVFPALKYTLGYGQACHRIAVEEESVVPQRAFTLGVK